VCDAVLFNTWINLLQIHIPGLYSHLKEGLSVYLQDVDYTPITLHYIVTQNNSFNPHCSDNLKTYTGITIITWFRCSYLSIYHSCLLIGGPLMHSHVYVRSKAVPLQAWSGPEVSRKLRFPDFMTTAQDGGKVIGLTHRTPLPPGNTRGTHFG
jgi:hypothetical protein